MARARRQWFEGAIYHVFSRGSNRQAIFLNHADYAEFYELLADAFRRHRVDAFGWSLMPIHWHGIVRSPAEGLSAFMKSVNHRYALRFDRRWRRRAHLFENRFGVVLQETEEQFLYKTRKKALGPFKRQLWDIPVAAQEEIGANLRRQFGVLFDQLGVAGTRALVDRFVTPADLPRPRPAVLGGSAGATVTAGAHVFEDDGSGE